jgi:hypothetical protein
MGPHLWGRGLVSSEQSIEKNILSLFSVSSQCAGSEVKPLTLDRGCDSVPLGQSNHTPHGAVIDEYGANGGIIFAGETEELRENLPSATLSTTNPTWKDPGANLGLRGERPATNRLSHGMAEKNIAK